MRVSDLLRRSVRSMRQAKARTFLTASAIAVGTFALTLTLAASNGAQDFVNRIINDNFDPAELIVAADPSLFGQTDTSKPKEYSENYSSVTSEAGTNVQIKQLDKADLDKIKAVPEVEQVRVLYQVSLQYLTRPGQKKYVGTVAAINPAQKPDLLAGSVDKPFPKGKVALPEGYLKDLGFTNAEDAIGKTITIRVRKPFNQNDVQSALSQGLQPANLQALDEQNVLDRELTIAAVLKKPTATQPGTELYLYTSTDDAAELNDYVTAGTPNYQKNTYVYVRVKDGENAATLETAQQKLKDMGYQAQSVEDTQEFLTQIISILRGIVIAFGAIAVIASIFGIINTMYISVLQRTREIGLMKALGMRKRDIGRLFRFEAAWIGFVGGLLGSLLAFGVGTLLNPWITKTLGLAEDQSLLIFKFNQIALLIAILIVVAILAGWLPSRKAAKLDPIEALRTE